MAARLESRIPQVIALMRSRASRVVRKTASGIVADVKTSMGGVKHGREYRRDGVTHRASAPGEAPAIESAENGYVHTVRSEKVDDLTSAAGTTDPRGPALELGGGRVAARPHFGPAFERAREPFEQQLGEIFE